MVLGGQGMNGCYNCDTSAQLEKEMDEDKKTKIIEDECDDCPYRF